MASERYPKQRAMFPSELEASYQRFAELREDFLIGYGYNTARAYWGDLEDILFWCVQRSKDPLDLDEREFKQYLALLRRRGYQPGTVRRRRTVYRGFWDHIRKCQQPQAGSISRARPAASRLGVVNDHVGHA